VTDIVLVSARTENGRDVADAVGGGIWNDALIMNCVVQRYRRNLLFATVDQVRLNSEIAQNDPRLYPVGMPEFPYLKHYVWVNVYGPGLVGVNRSFVNDCSNGSFRLGSCHCKKGQIFGPVNVVQLRCHSRACLPSPALLDRSIRSLTYPFAGPTRSNTNLQSTCRRVDL
jgi:hypothetical protein